jgi:hypothetical protein
VGRWLFLDFQARPVGSKGPHVCMKGTILSRAMPAPWLARVSTRTRRGLGPKSAAWSAATYLNVCPGTTRSSVSAVVARIAG